MPATPPEDIEAAHRFFSTHCFNKAWELIDKRDRDPQEDEQMFRLCQTSIWHWTQRPDCTPRHLSIGYWQASRVCVLLKRAEEARRYGQLSLEYAPNGDAFCIGYAYEALARAKGLAGDREKANEHLDQARRFCEQIADAEDKKLLLVDLESLAE